MNNKVKSTISIYIFIFCFVFMNSCKKESLATGTDKELFDMAKASTGFTWFQNSSILISKSSGSGHSQAFFKTKYNTKASSKLDSTGKIIPGSTFPEGSLIVKELYENSTTLDRYAILLKNTGSTEADANGWVWGYINSDGTVVNTASDKGSSCISCHSQIGNIDYMLMNKFFP